MLQTNLNQMMLFIGSFYVYVNGEQFGVGGGVTFGIDHDPTSNWTLTINSLNGGWSLQADFD